MSAVENSAMANFPGAKVVAGAHHACVVFRWRKASQFRESALDRCFRLLIYRQLR